MQNGRNRLVGITFKVMMWIILPYFCVYVDKVYAVQFSRIKSLMAVGLGLCLRSLRFRVWVGDLVLSDVCETSCACVRACMFV